MPHCKHIAAILSVLIIALATPAIASAPIFEDNFDSYSAGVYPPAPWTNMFSGSSCIVTPEQAQSGPHSLRSESNPNWARWDYVALTIPDLLTYEAAIYMTAADRGCAVGFGFVEPGQPNTGRWANAVFFANDGNIHFSTRTAGSALLGTWTTDRWYEIYVIIDYVIMVADVYIDGALAGDNVAIDPKTLPDTVYGVPVPLNQFGLFGNNFSGSGTSVIYYDNIAVNDETAVPTREATWGAIKAIYEQE